MHLFVVSIFSFFLFVFVFGSSFIGRETGLFSSFEKSSDASLSVRDVRVCEWYGAVRRNKLVSCVGHFNI